MASIPGAIIGAGASIISGILGSNAAHKAGTILENAGNTASNKIQNTVDANAGYVSGAITGGQSTIDQGKNAANTVVGGVFQGEQGNLNPYLQAGQNGINQFNAAIGPGGALSQQFQAPSAADAENTPGYQFQLAQGNQAVERSAAAGGLLQSGGTAKALDQYSQGLASTYYQNAYNNALTSFQTNRNNTFQDLSTVSGIGLNANQQYNQAAQNYGNVTSANDINAANAQANIGVQGSEFNANYNLNGANTAQQYYTQGQAGLASGTVGAANAWQNALNGVSGTVGSFNPGSYFSGPVNANGVPPATGPGSTSVAPYIPYSTPSNAVIPPPYVSPYYNP